ncbi:MAG: ATP-dependent helicase [Pseudonocardia sp.]
MWDDDALRVLGHGAGVLRVLGGPGSGKTTLLLAAAAARVRAGADPGRTLLLVGSRRAAVDLRERLTAQLQDDGLAEEVRTLREPLVRTLHSYAFGILRLHAARQGDPPPRLLAGAEQDAVVRDLLAGELAGDAPDSGWPDRVRPALHLPAFATELRELLMRAAERSLGPEGLAEMGERYGVDEWTAAGRFHQVYEHVVQLRGAAGRAAAQATAPALDSAELVTAALDALASDPELYAAESDRVEHLIVDDAQDLDPQQLELVRALGAAARSVLLAGDPDQAVLGFRGADPGGLVAIEAETVVLRGSHRSAPVIRAAAVALASRLPGAGPWRPGRGAGDGAVGSPDAAGPGSSLGEVGDGVAPGAGIPGHGPGDTASGDTTAVGDAVAIGAIGAIGSAASAIGDVAGAADGRSASAEGAVAVHVFVSAAQEANWVADRLRRAHLVDGVAWSQMAVLSRSTRRSLPALRRALLAAGVPIAAPPDELPLARQPAVVPLLMVLRFAARPDELDADAASALLTSVLGAADPMRLRRLRRALLRLHAAGGPARPEERSVRLAGSEERARPAGPDQPAGGPAESDEHVVRPRGAAGRSATSTDRDGDAATPVGTRAPADATDDERTGSDPLLVGLLRDAAGGRPDPLVPLPPREAAPLQRVTGLLAAAAEGVRNGESAEQVLWRVWERSGLAARWSEASARGGPVGAAADRDLDAVLALFDAAARYTDRLPGADVEGFTSYLSEQHLPGDTALAARSAPADAVALLTAHAARGREWEVVAVPGVQEGSWPDLRLRGSLLGQERLVDAVAGVADPAAAVSRIAPLLAEERRLFYVACTRARRTLLVSAVQGEDEQPSRFLDELDPVPVGQAQRPVHRPSRGLVLAELVGELRRAVTEPDPYCAACGTGPGSGTGHPLRAAPDAASGSEHRDGGPGTGSPPPAVPDAAPGAGRTPAVPDGGSPAAGPHTARGRAAVPAAFPTAAGPHPQPGTGRTCTACTARARRRERAALQLARLAEADVPGARPEDWYGLAPASTEEPLRAPGEVVPVSPSDVEKIMRCPLRWVLERHGGAEVGALAAVTGSLVHALVQARAAGADGAELEGALRSAWARLDAGAPWFGRRELARVRRMLSAFDEWVHTSRADGLSLVAVEHPVELDLKPERRGGPWLRLRGRVDRLEVDRHGRPVVVDVKTGKTAPTKQAVAEHAQLAVYQLAAALGAFGDVVDRAARPGGARLVYVADRLAAGTPKQPSQEPLDDDGVRHWRTVVEGCATDTSGGRFVARSGPDCDRCPVRTSCPLHDAGRPVPEG